MSPHPGIEDMKLRRGRDPGSVLSLHMEAYSCLVVYNSGSKGPDTFFWTLLTLGIQVVHIHIHGQNTQTHKIKEISNFEKNI